MTIVATGQIRAGRWVKEILSDSISLKGSTQ